MRACVPQVFISLIDTTSVGAAWVLSVGRMILSMYCVMMFGVGVSFNYYFNTPLFLIDVRFRLAGSVEDPHGDTTCLCLSFDSLSLPRGCVHLEGGVFCSPVR